MQKVHNLYSHYRNLTPKEKQLKIKEAQQHQKYRKPNPQADHRFSQQNFIDFKVYQGQKLIKLNTYRNYKSKTDFSDAEAVVVMFHGLNSHLGHGAHIAKALEQINVITVGFDHRGFGKSEGIQGYVETLESHLFDAITFVKKIAQMYPKLPMFLTGLSMGGLTSYHLGLKYPNMFAGIILMAPAMKNLVGGVLVSLVGTVSKLLPNSFRLIKPPRGKATKNPHITQFIQSDKYSFSGRASLSTLNMLIKAMQQTPPTFSKFTCPFVIVQGALDKLVNPQVAFQLYDNSPSKDKDIWFYDNLWHDIWHEEQIHDIIPKLKNWIKQRIPKIEKQ